MISGLDDERPKVFLSSPNSLALPTAPLLVALDMALDIGDRLTADQIEADIRDLESLTGRRLFPGVTITPPTKKT